MCLGYVISSYAKKNCESSKLLKGIRDILSLSSEIGILLLSGSNESSATALTKI